jgi:hypothetical protein
MGVNRHMTPVKSRKVYTSITLVDNNGLPDQGTFNGQLHTAATGGILSDRHFFRAYAEATSSAGRQTCGWQFHLPKDYIAGTNIIVRPIWTCNETTVNVFWELGLTDLDGQVLGQEAQTEWKTVVSATGTTGGNFLSTQMAAQTFSGVNLTHDKPIHLIVARDSKDASDSATVSAYIFAIEVIYLREDTITVENGVNKRMTPLEHRSIFRKVNFSPNRVEADTSATFDGLAVVNASLNNRNARYNTRSYPDADNRANEWNWIVPPDYKTGGVIKVVTKYVPSNTDTGDVWFFMGMCTDTIGTVFGDDSDTEYLNPSVHPAPMNGTIDYVHESTFTFSGTNKNAVKIAPGDPISFMHVRQGTAASDTFTGTIHVLSFDVYYESNLRGTL